MNEQVKTKAPMIPMRIFIDGKICDQMASEFIQLCYLRAHLHKEIEIYVNSVGGSVEAAMEMTSFILNLHKTHSVSTIGMSFVMSSAVDIFMAGEHRFAFKTCKWMQHHPHATMCATTEEMIHIAKEMNEDMEWGLIADTRDSLLTPAKLLAHITESRNQEFFFKYDFAKEHLLVNRDGLPPMVKGKCFSITGKDDQED